MKKTLVFLATLALGAMAGGTAHARTMEMEMVVNAPVATVWDLFTTEEGVTSWMVPKAEVDWRVGGTLRTHYDPKAEIGDPGTIVHHILAHEPHRMYASRFDAPDTAPVAKIAERTWGVVRFRPEGSRTRVTFRSLGWGEGEAWDQAWEFFRQGNRWTLNQLVARFPGSYLVERDPDARRRVEALLDRLAGGEWIHESRPEAGGLIRARNRIKPGPAEGTWVSHAWLGGGEGMYFHGATQVFRDPETGGVRFLNLNEEGDVARGEIRLDPERENALLWEWVVADREGGGRYLRIRQEFTGEDAYSMTMQEPVVGEGFRSTFELAFRRVDRAPAEFRVARDQARSPSSAPRAARQASTRPD